MTQQTSTTMTIGAMMANDNAHDGTNWRNDVEKTFDHFG
jgi:hypothetical protein